MEFEMNKNTFFKTLSENPVAAMKYKDNFIPHILYKYYPIFDERYVNYEKENEIRLNSLKNNEIWVSNYKKFNDPFEFKMLTLDTGRIEDNNWEIGFIEKILETFKKSTLVTCFSCEVKNNMPLWAHYANSHTGYCVKYVVKNPRSFFPVSYEPERIKTAVIPTMIISEMRKSFNENLKQPTEEFYKYFTYLYFSFTCKHEFWKYENEVRLLYNHFIDSVDGLAVPLDKVGLEVESIYLGLKCNEGYKNELKSIGKKLKCDIFQMYFDEYSNVFELNIKKV